MAMDFHPFEVNPVHIIYTCIGGFVVLFGMFSLFLREKLYVGEAIWAFIFGVIVGPFCANIFNPRGWGDEEAVNEITLEFTRVVLSISVFAIGVELPKAYMRKHWKTLFFLLAPIMTWGWFVSAALIYALVPALNFVSALAVAACLTPTDPILAAAITGGKYADKHVPAHIRHLLAAESGCNDGAAFPFLYIALYLIIHQGNVGFAVRDWFLNLWLYQIILGIVIGSLLGIAFRYMMKYCEKHDLIDRHSYVAQYVSLALLTVGITTLLGSDDLLSAFCCGAAFAWDGFFNRQTEESVFSSVIDLLFNIAAFIFIGAWMPFDKFQDAHLTLEVWRLIVLAICVLIVRRLPPMLLCYKWMPDVKTFREAIFSGHFGPMGVGAIFISTLAAIKLEKDLPEDAGEVYHILTESIQPISAFMVIVSIAVHGLSIPGFSLGRRVHSVSRTWSRHTSMAPDSRPEWAQQAKMVNRPEDVVINRDEADALERGEKVLEVSESPSTSSMEKKDEPTTELGAGADNPPDGAEVEQEWQEGPHLVIERRAGPGEEVEVEVIRNHGEPHAESSTFAGHRHHAHDQARSYMDAFKHKAQQGAEAVEHVEKEAEHKAKETVAPSHQEPDSPVVVVDDDDDEGWASETSSRPTGRRSPKSTGGRYKKKRRNSKLIHDEHRGRGVTEEGGGDPSRLRNPRLDTVRGQHRREPSTERSIRFAEQGPRQSLTLPDNPSARASVTSFHSARSFDPSTSTPQSPQDEPDSAKNRVTFELP